MADKDLYETLGIDKNADADSIKSAYRKMAKKYHPDVYATASAQQKAEAEAKFKEVQHAYDVLSDPQKKAAYDQYGSEDGPMGAGGFGGSGFGGFGGFGGGDFFDDIINAFTGGGRRSYQSGASSDSMPGEDIEITMPLSFKEACFGVEKEVTYQRIEKCATCGGTGAKNGTSYKTCTKCGGRGRVVINQRTMLGMMRTENVCDMCGGKGKIVTDPCPDCKGKGKVKKERTVKIKIPAGVDNDQMLTMRNEGHAGGAKGANGNLILIFKVSNHPLFQRNGSDLHLEFPITVSQAILGDTVEVPTPTIPVKVDIPEGTQDGTIVKIKGKGIKNLRNDSFGDMYVKFTIDVPKNLSIRQRRQLKDLEGILNDCKYDKIEKFRKKMKEM